MAKGTQIQPTVTVIAAPAEAGFEAKFGEYHMVKMKDGNEVVGSDFSMGEISFKKSFKARTAKPEGDAEIKDARFKVKKNPTFKK